MPSSTLTNGHYANGIANGVAKGLNGSPSSSSFLPHQTAPRPSLVNPPRTRTSFAFDSMADALAAFKAGEFLVVMDDENRENEGDLIIAASQCTTEKMAWMIKHTR
jgi:3,4-dihydroxy-2-butanone 4-phosphate synthase